MPRLPFPEAGPMGDLDGPPPQPPFLDTYTQGRGQGPPADEGESMQGRLGGISSLLFSIEQSLDEVVKVIPGSGQQVDAIKSQLRSVLTGALEGGASTPPPMGPQGGPSMGPGQRPGMSSMPPPRGQMPGGPGF